jgi:hypothetical protein
LTWFAQWSYRRDLATVQSIANQTLRGTSDPAQFIDKLIEKSLGGVGGSAHLRFDTGGLRCSIRLPLAANERVFESLPQENTQRVFYGLK